jgi:hypothetical protein
MKGSVNTAVHVEGWGPEGMAAKLGVFSGAVGFVWWDDNVETHIVEFPPDEESGV